MPAERGFATKPALVIDMLDRALAAGVPFRYFTAGYGRDPGLRARCHATALSYVLAVPVDLPLVKPGADATRPDHVLATVPKAAWARRSCGAGTKGARYSTTTGQRSRSPSRILMPVSRRSRVGETWCASLADVVWSWCGLSLCQTRVPQLTSRLDTEMGG